MRIARGQTSSCVDAIIDVYCSTGGELVDVVELAFAIFDVSTSAKQDAPVQVYPAVGTQEVNVAACPTGHRVSLGRYVAAWTVPADEPIGSHMIRWSAKLTADSSPVEWIEEFEVVGESVVHPVPGAYTTIERMRAQGLPESAASDAWTSDLIDEASRDIDAATRWWFEPRERTYILSGEGHDTLWLDAPPISIDSVVADGEELDYYYLRGSAPVRDGRKPLPALVRTEGLSWPSGVRNLTVTGTFGCTEDDGTEHGRTPRSIRRACELIAMRWARPLADDADERYRGRLRSMKTNRQSITLSETPVRDTAYDLDPEVSRILAAYRAPLFVAGV